MGSSAVSFGRAKAFSDFIGFHVRCVFLMAVAWFGLAPHITRIFIALQSGQAFVPTPFRIEVITFFFLYGLALTMFVFILVSVFQFFWSLDGGGRRRRRLIFLGIATIAAAMEIGTFMVLNYWAFVDVLRRADIPLEEFFALVDKWLRSQGFLPFPRDV